ncbi:sel1 repeat family protein [Paraburkholderia pallida]|uniref:Sel1 repeat family protein n=1 Tax=Paraburkholderia pallida TaxID=2547399 RepID=A0A4P7D842_9BURK|nr:sel1 repeat family protein [Paraburkholderia pallida]QBR03577.1 sel1 repeat family protein [Paraburkholderia pallida]
MPSQTDWSAVRAKLAFTCVHAADHLPALDPTADALFKYARYLQKQDGPKNYDEIARYYRIAAASGHYKANNNLQNMLENGQVSSPDAPAEAVDLASQLIKAAIPWGYYEMGHYLEVGYGVEQDAEKARHYFRQAADLGDPDAQYYVGDLLSPKDRAPDISRQMMRCAVDQGFGKAASDLGVDLMDSKSYVQATEIFQKGVEAGDEQSARFLANGFDTDTSDPLYYLELARDPERSRRYKLIGKFIDDHDGLNPKVPDIDLIVPLPPAKLPEWDGTFQWQKEQDAAVPPSKPAESLVAKLAREKNLDPATGLPLKPKDSRVPLGTTAYTNEACPQEGVWCAKQWTYYSPEATQHFSKGQTMPDLLLRYPRSMKILDALLGVREDRTYATWTLVSYSKQA